MIRNGNKGTYEIDRIKPVQGKMFPHQRHDAKYDPTCERPCTCMCVVDRRVFEVVRNWCVSRRCLGNARLSSWGASRSNERKNLAMRGRGRSQVDEDGFECEVSGRRWRAKRAGRAHGDSGRHVVGQLVFRTARGQGRRPLSRARARAVFRGLIGHHITYIHSPPFHHTHILDLVISSRCPAVRLQLMWVVRIQCTLHQW